jgi:hypothetical protein
MVNYLINNYKIINVVAYKRLLFCKNVPLLRWLLLPSVSFVNIVHISFLHCAAFFLRTFSFSFLGLSFVALFGFPFVYFFSFLSFRILFSFPLLYFLGFPLFYFFAFLFNALFSFPLVYRFSVLIVVFYVFLRVLF